MQVKDRSNELVMKLLLWAAKIKPVTFPDLLSLVCGTRVTQEDIFNITAVDLGVLKKLRIRHDNSQASAGWFLDRVEIIDNKDDTT